LCGVAVCFFKFAKRVVYLKPKMPLISAEEPLPPRGDMHEYLTPDKFAKRVVVVPI
jgi:hypothetical protein